MTDAHTCTDPQHANLKAFMEPADRLGDMFAEQGNLQRLLGRNVAEMTPDQLASYRVEMAFAATDELHEAMNETGWKSWASSRHVNEEEIKDELTDTWLFLLNLMLSVNMTAEDLYSRYAKKRASNERRHRERYQGIEKCPTCKRAYDNEAVKCQPPNICAYTVEDPRHDPHTQCARCKHDFADTRCAPASAQGFGWCDTLKVSFDIAGHVVGEKTDAQLV